MAKAQAFLIASIILIVIFVTLFVQIGIFQLLENKAMVESSMIITSEILNIKNEIGSIQSISYYSSDEEIKENIKNFTKFVKQNYETRERKVAIVTLFAFTQEKVNATENTILNISVFNERTEPIFNLTLNFTYDNSVNNITQLEDGSIWNTSFVFNASKVEPPYELYIFYRSKLFGKKDEKILLPIKVGEKFKLTWADVIVGG
jgi:hypothetical protein